MHRSSRGGGSRAENKKDVTAHIPPVDHVGFIYVSEGDISFQSGHLRAHTRQKADITVKKIMAEILKSVKKKKKE